VVEKGVRNW